MTTTASTDRRDDFLRSRPAPTDTVEIVPSAARTPYRVALDLGTTQTVAAVRRLDGTGQAPSEPVALGEDAAGVPTAVFVDPDGTLRFGDAAVDAGALAPERLVRGFRRRIGDPTPVTVAGQPWQPEELAAQLIRWAVDRIASEHGGPPVQVVLTHPISWKAHTSGLLRSAVTAHGLDVVLLDEPRAAALRSAAAHRLLPGSTIAVYDLGGSSLDVAVVRVAARSCTVIGPPDRDDHLGGSDIDDTLFDHVRATHPDLFASIDETDPADLAAVAQLRRACVAAKEQLSSDTEASIPVALAGHEAVVRLHRSEFETLVRPLVERSVDVLERVISAAGLEPADLTEVLLVGGSTRIPLVSQLVSQRLDRPVTVDSDPTSALARGAALASDPPGDHPGAVPGPAAAADLDSPDLEVATAAMPMSVPVRPARPAHARPNRIEPAVGVPARATRWRAAACLGVGSALTASVAAACIMAASPTLLVGRDPMNTQAAGGPALPIEPTGAASATRPGADPGAPTDQPSGVPGPAAPARTPTAPAPDATPHSTPTQQVAPDKPATTGGSASPPTTIASASTHPPANTSTGPASPTTTAADGGAGPPTGGTPTVPPAAPAAPPRAVT